MQADLFSEYPDVVTIEHIMVMLHIGRNAAYRLIQSGKIKTERIGRRYIIPKKSVISYVKSIQEYFCSIFAISML